MFKILGYQQKNVFIIGTILGFLPGLFAASVVKRSADFTNPCNSPGGTGVLPPFDTIINNLEEGTEGLKSNAAETKAFVGSRLKPSIVNTIDSSPEYTYIKDFPQSTVDKEILDMKFGMAQQILLQHWSHLYNMSVLVYHARTTGVIGTSGEDDGTYVSKIKNNMDAMELKIYEIACDMSIALAIKDLTDLPIPDYTMPSYFEAADNLFDEMIRAYVLMKDVEKVAGHLSEVYDGYLSDV